MFYEEEKDNYYGEEGCCLTCELAEESCLCYKCKCRKCIHYVVDYEPDEYGEYGSGHCGLTEPPEGRVKITLNRKCNYIAVRIEPYLKEEQFRNVVQILKDYGFHYIKEDKEWTRTLSEMFTPLLVAAIEKLGVKVDVPESENLE